MKTLVLAALLFAANALAAPHAADQEECMLFADMAVTARSFAIEGVAKEKTSAAMGRMYRLDERGGQILDAVIKAAYSSDALPEDFVKLLARACISQRGNMDSVLGVDS